MQLYGSASKRHPETLQERQEPPPIRLPVALVAESKASRGPAWDLSTLIPQSEHTTGLSGRFIIALRRVLSMLCTLGDISTWQHFARWLAGHLQSLKDVLLVTCCVTDIRFEVRSPFQPISTTPGMKAVVVGGDSSGCLPYSSIEESGDIFPRGKRQSSPLTTSPTTVTAQPSCKSSRSTNASPNSSLTFTQIDMEPATDPDAIQARALMAKYIYRVYVDFVAQGHFMYTDVPDQRGLLTSPIEDAMGVMAAAIAMVRAIYHGNTAAEKLKPGMHMSLDKETRHYMAAALFIAYKAKSEDSWKGGSMTRALLSRFVTELEYPDAYSRMQMARIIVQAEANILLLLPTLSLVDGNIHSMVEHRLAEMMNMADSKGKQMMPTTAAVAVLSLFGYYYNLVTVHTDTELIERISTTYSMMDAAMGFVAVGAASVAIAPTFEDCDRPSKELKFSRNSVNAAVCIVSAAARKDFQKYAGVGVHVQALTARSTILHAQAVLQGVLESM